MEARITWKTASGPPIRFERFERSRRLEPRRVFCWKFVNGLEFRRGAFYLASFLIVVSLMGCGRNERMDALYAERCFTCHGAGGRGDGALAASLPVSVPDFRQTVERRSTGQIREIITEGRGVMPAFDPALTPAQINDMVQMVRFLSREGRDVAWWENYDALVVAHCSVPWDAVLGYNEPLEPPQEPEAR